MQILSVFKKIFFCFDCCVEYISIECDSNSSYTKKYQEHIPYSFAYEVVCVDNKFSKKLILYTGKDGANRFIKSILSEYNYCRKMVKKYFCKNLIISAEENERFEMTNICWICNKLI